MQQESPESISHDLKLDASNLNCPMPLLKAKLALANLSPGQVLWVVATDAGSARDIPAWLAQVEHELLARKEVSGVYHFWIKKHD